ncbi:MAG: DUF1080 domain-containing protein [Planctomycetaceae bacterium]|nr:DUF1080 domain-containing protein [Planctomycetaceae bacterium]MCP4464072.1 DUF1080 domain-containing protein [Planctomycetaceae bacterium]MDG1807132.1 DUF1080 domain-containing protein [Pirellulaceae bacterium]MDG2105001.1 DUF1080 domain-containing protein [Pirellulaceae bacterium]
MMQYAFSLAALLVLVGCPLAVAQEDSPKSGEEIVLFDGKNLDQWRGYGQEAIGSGWKVEDGILKFDGSGGGDIITKETFKDFEFVFDWAVTDGANSGVMYKVSLGDNAPYLSGPEYQILDDAKHGDGKNPLTSAASLYGLYSSGDAKPNPVGEWNQGKIVISGNKIQHWLNGKLAVEAELGSPDWNERLNKSKFKDWKKFAVNKEGHLCLQDHGNEVWFRNLKVTKLDKDN